MPDDDREDINLSVGGKSFTINAPKGLSDDEVIRRTIRSDPEFAGLAKTNEKLAGIAAQEQAHSQMQSTQLTPPPPLPSTQVFKPQAEGTASPGARGGYFLPAYNSAEEARGGAKQAIIGTATAGANKAVQGLGLGYKMLGVGGASAASDVAGDVATGQQPSALEATVAGVTGGALEGLGPAVGKLIKPFITKSAQPISEAVLSGQISQKVAKLGQMADAEEGLRQSIVAAPRAIRKNVIDPLYPKIDELVNLNSAAKASVSESGQQIAHGTPSELLKTNQIGKKIGAIEGVIRELVQTDRTLASDPMQQAELLDTMQLLHDGQNVTFSQARNLRSALGAAIAKGEGYKLPAETYNTLRTVKDLVDNAVAEAADRAGKLPELRAADKVYSQFANDFNNKNAPLKGVLNLKEGMTGKTAKNLLTPANVNRAEAALRRWGMTDQADALRKMADMPNRAQAITEMEQQAVSPVGFKGSQMEAAKAADAARVEAANQALSKARSQRLKLGAGLVGGGSALYEGSRLLRGGKP